MKRKEVVLTKETRQKEFVKRVMNAISPHLELKSSDKVAIKIDLSGSKEIYANTHYETVESLIFYLKEHFAISDISVMEGSDGALHVGKTTWDIFYKFRYKEVELNGAKLVNLDELPHDYQLEVETIFGPRQVHYAKCEADYVITVIPPKTHHIFPATLAIPNIIGYVKQEDRGAVMGAGSSELKKFNFSNTDRYVQLIDLAGKNLVRLLKEVKPSMALIDGLYGMEGKGPIKGSPVFHGFAIASEDVVLADSLTTYVMGFEVDEVSYLYYAYKEGLGNNRWQNIIGVDPCHVKFPYRPHPMYPKQKIWRDTFQEKKRYTTANENANGNRPTRPEKNYGYRKNKPDKFDRPYKNYDKDRNYRPQNGTDNQKKS